MTGVALKISSFAGEVPISDARLLPDMAAVTAENCDLLSGALGPIRYPLLAHTPVVSGPWLTTYRAESNGAEKWRDWSRDVDVIQVPLDQDVEQQYCWTGDGEPRTATFTDFGTTDYALGTPNPTTACSVSHSGGTGSAVTRFYRYTNVQADGKESGPSPVSEEVTGKIDGTWAIGLTTPMQAFPANSGTGTAAFVSGVTTFTNSASALHWLRVGDEVVLGGDTLTVIAVPTADSFKVAGDYSAETTWARKANWNTSGMYRRLYRTSGSTGSWQLVADNITATTYYDTLTDAQIEGDELITDGWEPPPAGLFALGVLPSGACYGLVGRMLCFSEPYQPHAWPPSYQLGLSYDGVGCASYGTVVVVATKGTPHFADGIEPASAVLQKVDNVWPCQSKRSVCSVGDGVIYASPHGLVYVGQSGPSIWTEGLIHPNQWADMVPSSMISVTGYGKVLVSYMEANATSRKALLFQPGSRAGMTRLDIAHTELYADQRNGRLYFVDEVGVKLYDAGSGTRMQFVWESKDIELPAPVNLGAARVEFDSEMSDADYAVAVAAYDAAVAANAALVTGYAGVGGYNGYSYNEYAYNGSDIMPVELPDIGSVTFTLKSRGVTVASVTLATQQSFRLPGGYKSDLLSVHLTGTVKVHSVKLAETMRGLALV